MNKSAACVQVLMVIGDATGEVFGAYLTCVPRQSENFIGTGKSWLFAFDNGPAR